MQLIYLLVVGDGERLTLVIRLSTTDLCVAFPTASTVAAAATTVPTHSS